MFEHPYRRLKVIEEKVQPVGRRWWHADCMLLYAARFVCCRRLKVIEENTDRTARRKKKLLTNFDPSSTSAADNLPTSLRTGDRVGKITFESFGDYNADHRYV
jgi:hypothetical protein